MKRIKSSLVILLWISGMFLNAQSKLKVLDSSTVLNRNLVFEVFDKNIESLKKNDYKDKSLCWELTKCLFDSLATEIDNPESLKITNKNLKDSIDELHKLLIGKDAKLLNYAKQDSLYKKQLHDKQVEATRLFNQKDSLQREIVKKNKLEEVLKTKENDIYNLQKEISDWKSKDKEAMRKITQLENSLKQFGDFKRIIESKTGDFNIVFSRLESSLLSVTPNDIKLACEKVSFIQNDFPDLATRVTQMKKIDPLIILLNNAKEAITKPYDVIVISKLITEINSKQNVTWAQSQKDSVNAILVLLKEFDSATKAFEQIVDDISFKLKMFNWEASERIIPTMLDDINSTITKQTKKDSGTKNACFFEGYHFLNQQLELLRNKIQKEQAAPNVPKTVLDTIKRSVRKQK